MKAFDTKRYLLHASYDVMGDDAEAGNGIDPDAFKLMQSGMKSQSLNPKMAKSIMKDFFFFAVLAAGAVVLWSRK